MFFSVSEVAQVGGFKVDSSIRIPMQKNGHPFEGGNLDLPEVRVWKPHRIVERICQ